MLLLSLLMLFVGPLLFSWFSSSHAVARTVDRFIVVILVVMVGVLLVPEIIEPLGAWALLLLVLGYLLPGVLERLVKQASEAMHLYSILLALAGLFLHALLDGAGLAGSKITDSLGLAAAIILHRFGVGLMLWMIVQPVYGNRGAWLTLFGMAAATVLGYEFSEWLLPLAGDVFINGMMAVIIGTIIHGLVHRSHVHREGNGHVEN